MKKHINRINIFLIGLIFLMNNCTSQKNEPAQPVVAQKVNHKEHDDIKKEIEVGRNVAGKLIAAFGLYNHPKVNAYINLLGQTIAANSDAPNRKYTFHILNTSHINAYSAPGGYIFITRGALLNAKNEAELAAILGHEIAHVAKAHVYNTVKALKEKDKVQTKEMKARQRPHNDPNSDSSDNSKVLAKMVGLGGTAAVALFKAMANAAYDILINKGIDQMYEFEADQSGVLYALRAGYSPLALESYLKRLHKIKSSKTMQRQGHTHPSIANRVNKLNKYRNKNGLNGMAKGLGVKRFMKMLSIIQKEKSRA